MDTYVLGFTIYDARGLVTTDNAPVDPYVVVRCCGKEFQTEIKEQRKEIVTWNTSCNWADIQLYEEQFESAYVEFSVYARNWFSANELIGSCQLQLSSIHKRKSHVYSKKWLTLRNEDNPDVMGRLKVTAFCLAPGNAAPGEDEAAEEEGEGEEDEEDYADLNRALLGPIDTSSIGGKAHHAMITVHRVEDLPKSGQAGIYSPFVTVEFAGMRVNTTTARNVVQYTFNETARIPVMTPVYEDTILVKLWSYTMFGPDELLAQGFISFSEIRNAPLQPRWFNFYGWNTEEVGSIDTITATGENIEPNFYTGRLLISARVDRLANPEEMQSGGIVNCRVAEEPVQVVCVLVADVYQVSGMNVGEIFVEIQVGCGAEPQLPNWVPFSSDRFRNSVSDGAEATYTPTFEFSQTQGRIPMIVATTSENPDDQYDVMINVYKKTMMGSKVRIGYCRVKLRDIPKYEPGNARVPTFFPIKPVVATDGLVSPQSSILMTLERSTTDDIARHARKRVSYNQYVLRSYIYMARNCSFDGYHLPNLSVNVSCAGSSKATKIENSNVRPTWMQMIKQEVTLLTDHPKKPPTMEPIVVSLVNNAGVMSGEDLGKALCKISYMRQKDDLGEWEPFDVRPQWVKLWGGKYGSKYAGDILVAFELVRKNIEEELPVIDMWPKLRDCTLTFSLLGLRNLHFGKGSFGSSLAQMGMPGSGFFESIQSSVQNPKVDVLVRLFHPYAKKYLAEQNDVITVPAITNAATDEITSEPTSRGGEAQMQMGPESQRATSPRKKKNLDDYTPAQEESTSDDADNTNVYYKQTFYYQPVREGGDAHSKEDQNKQWVTQQGTNFEFLQVASMQLQLAEDPVYDPWITVRVWEQGGNFWNDTLVGEVRMPMGHYLPWLHSEDEFKTTNARDEYREPSYEERMQAIAENRKKNLELERSTDKVQHLSVNADEVEEYVNNLGLPLELRESVNKAIMATETFPITNAFFNMKVFNFPLMYDGEPERRTMAGGSGRPMVSNKLENDKEYQQDFIFKGRALTRGAECRGGDMDPQYVDGNYGFVKACFLLKDGFPTDEDICTLDEQDSEHGLEDFEEAEQKYLEQNDISLQWRHKPEHAYAWAEAAFRKRFKDREHLPASLRVRLYFVKGIAIFNKGSGFVDPYLEYRLGQDIQVSMRNMHLTQTNTPAFYRVDERNIKLPEEGQLQLEMKSYDDFGLDDTIGGTYIDLEDRWFSPMWQNAYDKEGIPTESRGMWAQASTVSRGNIEMYF